MFPLEDLPLHKGTTLSNPWNNKPSQKPNSRKGIYKWQTNVCNSHMHQEQPAKKSFLNNKKFRKERAFTYLRRDVNRENKIRQEEEGEDFRE